MELCLLHLLILIDCFFCNYYPCVLIESLSHVINLESYVCLFIKFGENLPHSFFEILKSSLFHSGDSRFQKSELGKFILIFPLKHVITSTNRFKIMGFL